MMVTKTIAVIGDTGKFRPSLVKMAAEQQLRLLFVSHDVAQNEAAQEELKHLATSAEIEFIHCEKEGCWEADMIAFTYPETIDPKLLARIKDVATQKIVLVVSDRDMQTQKEDFQELLPHSQVVNLKIDAEEKKFVISGHNVEAVNEVEQFMKNGGYNL